MPKKKRPNKRRGNQRAPGRSARQRHRSPQQRHRDPGRSGPVGVILREAANVLAEAEPRFAERWASAVQAFFRPQGFPSEAPLAPVEVLRAIERRPGPDAALVARSMEIFGPLETRPEAGRLYAALRGQDVAPEWLDELGAVTPGRVVKLEHAYRDGYSLHLEVTDRAGVVESIWAEIDLNLGGIVTDVLVGPPTEHLIDRAVREPHLTVEPVAPAAARAQVEVALAELDHTLDPPVQEDVIFLRALLEQRFALLPGGGSAASNQELPEAERRALVEAFAASPHAQTLDEDAREIAETLCDFANYSDGDPLRWSPTVVAIFLLDWVPRKVIADSGWHRSVPEVLRAWVRFAGERRRLPDELIEETVQAVDAHAPEFFEGLSDITAWGPAKRLLVEMQEAGVDPLDPEAVAAFTGADPLFALGDDFDEEALIEAWERLDAEAVSFLREALAEHRRQPPPIALPRAAQALRAGLHAGSWPFDYLVGLLDLAPDEIERLPDTDLLLAATGAFVVPGGLGAHGPAFDPEELALAHMLDHGAWLHIVTTAVRLGPGADVSPLALTAALADHAGDEDEEAFANDDDLELLEAALELNAPLWEAVGVTDGEERLTELGTWLLPRALARGWDGDFDAD